MMGAAETGSNDMLTVYGTVEDEFGVPTSWFLVGYENMNTNTGKVSEFEDGKYYLEIENTSIGDVISLNFTDGKCFVHKEITIDSLPMIKELNITLDPMREMPKPAHFEKPDIDRIKEAMKPLNDKITLPERPKFSGIPPVSSGNESNETNETSPPIIMSDMGAYPLELPELVDTNLNPKDLKHPENIFPKFMAFEGKENMLYVELRNVGNI